MNEGSDVIRELGAPGAPTGASPLDELDPNEGILSEEERTREATTGTTALDTLEEELGEEVSADDTFVDVLRRPGYRLRFPSTLDGETMKIWARRSADKKAFGGIDELKLALLIVSNMNNGVERNGEILCIDGKEITVRHRVLLEILKQERVFDGVRKLFGSDGHVMAAAREVLSECGYGEDLVAAAQDPTPRSSNS